MFAKQRSTPEEDTSSRQCSIDQNAFVADTQTPFYGNVIGRYNSFNQPRFRGEMMVNTGFAYLHDFFKICVAEAAVSIVANSSVS